MFLFALKLFPYYVHRFFLDVQSIVELMCEMGKKTCSNRIKINSVNAANNSGKNHSNRSYRCACVHCSHTHAQQIDAPGLQRNKKK